MDLNLPIDCFWSLETGEQLGQPMPHQSPVRAVFCTTNQRVITLTDDGWVQLWSPTGESLGDSWATNAARVAFSQEHVPEGEPVCTLQHPQIVEDLSFSHDGTLLLTACGDGNVRFWSLESRTEVRPPLVHNDSVLAIKLSPDGRLIATGSRDQTARLWDFQTGARVGPILDHAQWVEDLAFSPNGQFLVTGSADGNVQLWSVSSGERIGAPFPHPKPVRAVAFDPDGTHILVGIEDRSAQAMLWAIPRPERVLPIDLDLRAQAQTGERMDQDGVLRRLSAAEWRAVLNKLHQRE